MRCEEICESLLQGKRFLDLFRLTRFFYKYTKDGLIDDSSYSLLEQIIAKQDPSNELLHQTYDDDSDEAPELISLIEEFDLKEVYDDFVSLNADFTDSTILEIASEDKSLSIQPLEDYESAFDFFMRLVTCLAPDALLNLTPKVNGWNSRTFFRDSNYKGTFSRARKAKTPMNFSQNAQHLFPRKVSFTKDFTVYAELVADLDKYRELPRPDYSEKPFTSARMAAGSLIRTCKDRSLLKNLKFYAFNAEGVADTIHETLDILADAGFTTVPYHLVKASEVPREFDAFCNWLKPLLDEIWKESLELQIPTDGVVVDVDDKNFVADVHDQYASRNCALKFEHWSYAYYEAKVKAIKFEQQEVQVSCVIEIEPLQTDDNVCAQRVTGYNLSKLLENGVEVGKTIFFARSSEAINVLISKEKAAELSKRSQKL